MSRTIVFGKPFKMQSRYLIWIDCNRIDDKGFSIEKQLIIPTLDFDTFITFLIRKVGSEIHISLDDSTKSLLRGRNIKCKCLIYDAINMSRGSKLEDEATLTGYFGSLLEITLIGGVNCDPFSSIAYQDCYCYDPSIERMSTAMNDQVLLHIPIKPTITYKKLINTQFLERPFDFEMNPSLFSFVCGNYIFPKRFYDFLHENQLFYTNLVQKRVQYWFKNFDDRFHITHFPGIGGGKCEGYMLTVVIRQCQESLEIDAMKALLDLYKNQINFVETDKASLIYGKAPGQKRRFSEPAKLRSTPTKKQVIRSLLPPKTTVRRRKERTIIPAVIRWRY